MKVRLVVVQGRPEGQEIPLPMPEFLIGRDPQCNLCPSSDAASRLHCKIIQRAGKVFVRDLNSTNGTFLNGERVDGELQVFDGDLLQVGSLAFAFRIPGDSAASSVSDSPIPAASDRALAALGSKTPTSVLRLPPKMTRQSTHDTELEETT